MAMLSKVCGRCKECKPLTDYHKRQSAVDKLDRICKPCKKILHADHYQRNKEKLNKQNHEYYCKNKEHLAKKAKEWYERNREHVLEREKAYYITNRERILERVRQYKINSHEKVLESGRKSAANRRVYRQARDRQRVQDLPDWYVKKKLLGLKKDIEVPQALIEARRVLHQLKRSVK